MIKRKKQNINGKEIYIPVLKNLKSAQTREVVFRVNFPEFYEYLQYHYCKDFSFQEKLYLFYNNLSERPVCNNCGKPVKFINCKTGYAKFCCKKCSNANNDKQEKTKQTCLKKFGCIAPAGNKNVQYKMKTTTKERFGVDNVFKSKEIRKKINNTLIARYGGIGNASEELKEKQIASLQKHYGVSNAMFSNEIKEKLKETNFKKYSSASPFGNDNVKQKIVETCIERYGSSTYFGSDNWKEKTTKTCTVKYNKQTYFGSDNWKQKTKEIWMEKYGVENPGQSDIIKQKIANTCLEKYDNQTYFGSAGCIKKSKQTCLERYGVESHMKLECVKQKIYDTKHKNNSFNKSSIEEQFASWLDENNISYIRQYKSEQYPFCCDFYFPEKDLYFEINGFWTHGMHPFNANNENDINKLNEWKQMHTKFYNNAINTWTVSDPLKVKTANENGLNFKVVYSDRLNDVVNAYNEANR